MRKECEGVTAMKTQTTRLREDQGRDVKGKKGRRSGGWNHGVDTRASVYAQHNWLFSLFFIRGPNTQNCVKHFS